MMYLLVILFFAIFAYEKGKQIQKNKMLRHLKKQVDSGELVNKNQIMDIYLGKDFFKDANAIEDFKGSQIDVRLSEYQASWQRQREKLEQLKKQYLSLLNETFQQGELTYQRYMFSLDRSVHTFNSNCEKSINLIKLSCIDDHTKALCLELTQQNDQIIFSIADVITELQKLSFKPDNSLKEVKEMQQLARQTKLYIKKST